MKTQDEPILNGELQGPGPAVLPQEQHLQWLLTLARNVKSLRRIKKVSQQDLASRCGIFRTYLSRIETGKCNPSLTVLVALSTALEVMPHELLSPLE